MNTTLILAFLAFIIVAIVSWKLNHRIPDYIFKNLDYALVIIGFVGVLAAISQIDAEKKKTESLELVNQAKETFGSLMQRIEYRMDDCGVWWDIALDQTNKEPVECNVNDACAETCRMAHFVSQYRWRPIDTQIEDWENFKLLVCGNLPQDQDPLCPYAERFFEALEKANSSETAADSQFFSNKKILISVQFLIAITLGLEIAKIKKRRLKTKN